jgi:hypothetical protein
LSGTVITPAKEVAITLESTSMFPAQSEGADRLKPLDSSDLRGILIDEMCRTFPAGLPRVIEAPAVYLARLREITTKGPTRVNGSGPFCVRKA